MKIIYNRVLPFGDFGLLNILGLVFSKKKESKISLSEKVHEQIHTIQQYELLCIAAIISLILCNIFQSWWYLIGVLLIPFVLYILGFILEIIIPPYHNTKLNWSKGDGIKALIKNIGILFKKIWLDAYHDNCFEREAYANDDDITYLVRRKVLNVFGYIIPVKDRK